MADTPVPRVVSGQPRQQSWIGRRGAADRRKLRSTGKGRHDPTAAARHPAAGRRGDPTKSRWKARPRARQLHGPVRLHARVDQYRQSHDRQGLWLVLRRLSLPCRTAEMGEPCGERHAATAWQTPDDLPFPMPVEVRVGDHVKAVAMARITGELKLPPQTRYLDQSSFQDLAAAGCCRRVSGLPHSSPSRAATPNASFTFA